MKFFLTDGFHHHHIQSRDRSPPQHRMQNLSGFSEKSGASARTKSVTGFCGCDMQVAETKTARFPEETAPFSKPVNSGEVLMGCQKCTSMREKRQSLQVRAR
ncbi:hypothetical protein [Agrobacterium tumefaciens]|uniref:hypothetical protein n=1 Tax=Agrobacterium tumefaciens TaxID=358 RepID=UPI0015757B75|nr:hypothetical protein [Agrobacterium tumefaciens]